MSLYPSFYPRFYFYIRTWLRMRKHVLIAGFLESVSSISFPRIVHPVPDSMVSDPALQAVDIGLDRAEAQTNLAAKSSATADEDAGPQSDEQANTPWFSIYP